MMPRSHHLSDTRFIEELSLEDLLAEDSPVARMSIYLRLLYSSYWADLVGDCLCRNDITIAAATRKLLSNIDWHNLRIEQQARQRNLFAQLLRRSATMMAVFGEHKLREMLVSFTNMPHFWQGHGRTLLENFALAMQAELREQGNDFESDVLVLLGMISGIHSSSDMASPWTILKSEGGGPIEVEGYERAESFLTRWHLLGEDGALPDESNLSQIKVIAPHRIFVVCLPNYQVSVLSAPL